MIEELLQHGARPKDGIYQAILKNRHVAIRMLVAAGADPRRQYPGHSGSALEVSKEYGDEETRLLLANR